MHKFFGGYVLSFFIDCLVIVFLALLKKKTITVTSLWARSVWKKIEILILKADSGNFKHLHFPRHLAKIIQGSFFTNLQSSIIYICTKVMVTIIYLHGPPETWLTPYTIEGFDLPYTFSKVRPDKEKNSLRFRPSSTNASQHFS